MLFAKCNHLNLHIHRDNWAKTQAINKNVKIYIGAPASPSAAGSGYVNAATLGQIARETRSRYSSFGGVMLWDASQAYGTCCDIVLARSFPDQIIGNGRFDVAVKNAITQGGTITTTPTQPTTSTTSKPPGSGNCAGVSPWSASAIYVGGLKVTYNGRLYTSKWWTQGETPGSADVWADNGACTAGFATAGAEATPAVAPAQITGVKASRFFKA
ncbi:hypothetical protein DXG03_005243 [Asterophora parasitica]|uniref:Chitin-binding type-3 domain-containing protein n=1 Tax=Asterophora parasitica TaxID=117018 RepID=A0A9P7G6J4_9AGAR|nr:hypothetical protein DXG03_005243 [Asterophora parasitica]